MANEFLLSLINAQAIGGGSTPAPVLIDKTITANGEYDPADDDADGYSSVSVEVSGGSTLTTKSVTTNGTYKASDDSADGYSKVTVNVANSYAEGDEGKVVSNGALVSQTSDTATQNGEYDTTLINSFTVDVEGGSATLITKSISANGTYAASDDNADGYSSVTVSVANSYTQADEGKVVSSGALVSQTTDSATTNGTVDTTTISSLTVNVPNTYAAGDEGKVVSNGALVAQSSSSTSTNGTVDTTLINSLAISVPNSYTAQDEGKVVSSGALVAQTAATFTENGTYDTTGISSITIAVPVPVTAHIYGVVWDKTSSTVLSRTDDAALFTDPVPALSGGNGTSPFDSCAPWSGMVKETISGSVLVKIPKFWYKWTSTSSTLKLQIADKAVAGFHVSPAHADRGDGKGERDYVYIARYKCSSTDYKSVTGKPPKVNITRDAARTAIKALGTGFYQQDFAMFWTTRMLYLVEYANWNSQAAIGYGCGNNSSVQITGASDTMTYHTGTMKSTRTAYGVGVQYRWIEDPWGNVREWCDGIYFSSSNVYCINNPANFSDTTGGTKVGTRPTTDGYISDWSIPTATGFEYALYPSAVSGGEQTYMADYCYYYSSGVTLSVGGDYGQYQGYGMFCLDGSSTASSSYGYLGARLQYLP